ncbi:MAG TPA: hypothetical protein VFN59_08875 [Acidimicrobiales bacterium]|nr:hypothetical protein [Acidimicrobiales bacterium]
MIVTRAVIVVALLGYGALWVLAGAGATSLVAPLLIPLVLALLVGVGVALNRFLGTSPRAPRFNEPTANGDGDPPEPG